MMPFLGGQGACVFPANLAESDILSGCGPFQFHLFLLHHVFSLPAAENRFHHHNPWTRLLMVQKQFDLLNCAITAPTTQKPSFAGSIGQERAGFGVLRGSPLFSKFCIKIMPLCLIEGMAFSLGTLRRKQRKKERSSVSSVPEKGLECVKTCHKRESSFSISGEFFPFVAFSTRPWYISYGFPKNGP